MMLSEMPGNILKAVFQFFEAEKSAAPKFSMDPEDDDFHFFLSQVFQARNYLVSSGKRRRPQRPAVTYTLSHWSGSQGTAFFRVFLHRIVISAFPEIGSACSPHGRFGWWYFFGSLLREYTGDDGPCLAMSEVGGLASSGHESPAT